MDDLSHQVLFWFQFIVMLISKFIFYALAFVGLRSVAKNPFRKGLDTFKNITIPEQHPLFDLIGIKKANTRNALRSALVTLQNVLNKPVINTNITASAIASVVENLNVSECWLVTQSLAKNKNITLLLRGGLIFCVFAVISNRKFIYHLLLSFIMNSDPRSSFEPDPVSVKLVSKVADAVINELMKRNGFNNFYHPESDPSNSVNRRDESLNIYSQSSDKNKKILKMIFDYLSNKVNDKDETGN